MQKTLRFLVLGKVEVGQGSLKKWTRNFTQTHILNLQLREDHRNMDFFWTMIFYNIKKFTSGSFKWIFQMGGRVLF